MIKTEFSFFQIPVKLVLRHPVELGQPAFGKAPKGFYAVNMTGSIRKFIAAVMHPVVFVITNIYQPVIAAPTVTMYNAFGFYPE